MGTPGRVFQSFQNLGWLWGRSRQKLEVHRHLTPWWTLEGDILWWSDGGIWRPPPNEIAVSGCRFPSNWRCFTCKSFRWRKNSLTGPTGNVDSSWGGRSFLVLWIGEVELMVKRCFISILWVLRPGRAYLSIWSSQLLCRDSLKTFCFWLLTSTVSFLLCSSLPVCGPSLLPRAIKDGLLQRQVWGLLLILSVLPQCRCSHPTALK